MMTDTPHRKEGSDRPLSVSAAMAWAKGALEQQTLTLVGEVSQVSDKAGYKAVYFTVKDKAASLPCMMWVNRYQRSGVRIRVGALLQITGRFTLYAPKGRMNFDVFSLAVAGEGDLRLKVAESAKRLETEGLMDPGRKRPLPVCPDAVGLVTSPRGAAVHDVLRTLRRRFPLAAVFLAGVPVEGPHAADDLAKGIALTVAAGAEVVLLVRGGGSFEDLMPFNDESLARAIAACPVPVVTGIGHEPDTSIADMVADVRASTPTAAAEAVSPARDEMIGRFASAAHALEASLDRSIERQRLGVERLASHPAFRDPVSIFGAECQALDIAADRLQRVIPANLERDRTLLASQQGALRACGRTFLARFDHGMRLQAARLDDLSPLAVLGRGYSMTTNAQGDIIRSVTQADVGDSLSVALMDGRLSCAVEAAERIESTRIEWEE